MFNIVNGSLILCFLILISERGNGLFRYINRKLSDDGYPYRQWIADGKKLPLENVIELTNRIVLDGVNGFFKH